MKRDNPWDVIPLALCINLREREDRLAEARAAFEAVGLGDRVVFYHPERAPKGCFDSHIRCLEYAIAAGVPWFIVFEDDVRFEPGWEKALRHFAEFLRSGRTWNLFYLGSYILRRKRNITPHIIQGMILCTHACVIRTGYAKELVRDAPAYREIPIDFYYILHNWTRSYASVYPMACTQSDSPTDSPWRSGFRKTPGWWGRAMVFTSLTLGDRFRYRELSFYQRLQIHNGLFIIYLYTVLLRLRHALGLIPRNPSRPIPAGTFREPNPSFSA